MKGEWRSLSCKHGIDLFQQFPLMLFDVNHFSSCLNRPIICRANFRPTQSFRSVVSILVSGTSSDADSGSFNYGAFTKRLIKHQIRRFGRFIAEPPNAFHSSGSTTSHTTHNFCEIVKIAHFMVDVLFIFTHAMTYSSPANMVIIVTSLAIHMVFV